ncbi:ATP-binding cassette domain-containing protein [Anaerobacillus isosaccharinicus]|uniref:ATP-binding cassette domain-containing protein n=1 Tax=Anaerobacillus isosaccharinicus TaxID=1532552 RepID=A0AC62A4B6_9BACI|nr:ATP-binding cassette domain-containing protein [Anaerobacillus isosaccharinicus]
MFQVDNLSFKYPKNKENTIQDINFEIKEGEIFGLLGPSGVGKSTTQKILIKLLTNYHGNVQYKSKDLKSFGKEFYQEVGVGFEMPVHFSKLTANENLTFFKKLYKTSANTDELLQQVGLFEDRNKQVNEYSKGMKAD